MTHLRKMTLDEIARRNYTEGTTRAYLRIIEDVARYFHRSPDQLGPEQIREYVAHLFRDKKLSEQAREISRWQQRAARAEALVALQKQVAALLGTPLTGEHF